MLVMVQPHLAVWVADDVVDRLDVIGQQREVLDVASNHQRLVLKEEARRKVWDLDAALCVVGLVWSTKQPAPPRPSASDLSAHAGRSPLFYATWPSAAPSMDSTS